MVLFITRAFPMAVTAVLCSLAMGIMLPSVKLSAIYSGFGSAPVCMIAGMMIVGDAIFQTGVAQKMGVAIGKLRIVQNERIFTVVVVTICTFMSAFMSDSGCIAMWMPIIAAVAAGSRGKSVPRWSLCPPELPALLVGQRPLLGQLHRIQPTVSSCRQQGMR